MADTCGERAREGKDSAPKMRWYLKQYLPAEMVDSLSAEEMADLIRSTEDADPVLTLMSDERHLS